MIAQPLRTERTNIGLIHVPARMRSHIDEERVAALADSMRQIGLMTPITVYNGEHTDADGDVYSGPILIAGHHRLLAARRLCWAFIESIISNADEFDRRRWEIAENLHRSELTVQERAEHIAEWVRLSDAKVAQVAHPSGGKQPHSKGMSVAARDLHVERRDVQRAVKIDSIAPEAKAAARAAKVDDNQSALLKVASAAKEKQVEEVRRIAEAKAQKRPPMDVKALWLWGRLRDFERMGVLSADPQALLGEMTEPMRGDALRLARTVCTWLQALNESTGKHPGAPR